MSSPKFQRNPIAELVDVLEDRNGRWIQCHECYLLHLIPGLYNVAQLDDEEIVTLCGGQYCFDLGAKYVVQNEYGATLELLIHESQFKYDDWKRAHDRYETLIKQNGKDRKLLEHYISKQKINNAQVTAQCTDDFIILKCVGIQSRHGRGEQSKKKGPRKYACYFGWNFIERRECNECMFLNLFSSDLYDIYIYIYIVYI